MSITLSHPPTALQAFPASQSVFLHPSEGNISRQGSIRCKDEGWLAHSDADGPLQPAEIRPSASSQLFLALRFDPRLFAWPSGFSTQVTRRELTYPPKSPVRGVIHGINSLSDALRPISVPSSSATLPLAPTRCHSHSNSLRALSGSRQQCWFDQPSRLGGCAPAV